MTIRTITIDDSELTDENINDIMDIAGYSIGYWAERMHWDDYKGIWVIWESETERNVYVSHNDIRNAYFKLLNFDQPYVNKTVYGYIVNSWQNRNAENGVDTGDIDTEAADVIVQVSVFDELVYG